MTYDIDILLCGTMGDIADTAQSALATHGLKVMTMPFAQNVFRDEQGYRRELLHTLREVRPRVIMPVGHTLVLSRLAHPDGVNPPPEALSELLKGICIPVDTPDKIMLLDSKVQASALATRLDIPQPRFFHTIEEVSHWPVIFKRDRSFGGSGVHRPESPVALSHLMASQPGKPFLIEEYIEGDDVSVDFIRTSDALHARCYRLLSRRQGQGPSTAREPIERPDIIELGSRLLRHIDYRGVCGMDFRLTSDGEPRFLECNPRLTGGLATHLAEGFDIPFFWYTYALSEGAQNSSHT